MNNRALNEDSVLQVLRVEEPLKLSELKYYFPDKRVDEIDVVLWELHRQNRVHRIPRVDGECWYFGGIEGGTPARTHCTQAELVAMEKLYAALQLAEKKPVKLYYHDGNPILITGAVSSAEAGIISVTGWPVLPEEIASSEPVRELNHITGYLGVRFFVGKEKWVVVGPEFTFSTIPQEETDMAKPKTTAVSASAPAVPAGEFRHLPLDIIVAQSQIRKFFDEEKLKELAQSIKENGVLEPIIVRPVEVKGSERWQIVAGERRYRASKIAGLTWIPAICRELSDEAALEIQITENIQRADLHPLEEAYGYQALRDQQNISVSEICLRLGRGEKYVHHRLRLLGLPEITQQALWKNELTLGACLQIARLLENPKDQIEVTKYLLSPNTFDEDKTEAAVAEHIKDEYLTLLADAPFSTKDATLVPSAGACTTCLKRTGGQAILFDDKEFAKKDSCLDRACFQNKQKAHVKAELAKAEANGQRVLIDEEVKKVMPYSGGYVEPGRYVKLDDKVHQDEKYRSYGKLLGKDANVILAVKDDKIYHLVEKKEAQAAIAAKHEDVKFAAPASDRTRDFEAEQKRDRAARQTVFAKLIDYCREFLNFHDPEATAALHAAAISLAARNIGPDGQRAFCTVKNLFVPKFEGTSTSDYLSAIRNYEKALPEDNKIGTLIELVMTGYFVNWVQFGGEHRKADHDAFGAAIGFDFNQEFKIARKAYDQAAKEKAKAKANSKKGKTK